MATLNELAYNVLNIARGGLSSDDDRLNTRQIKFWIGYYRAKLTFEYTNAGKDIDPQLLQDLGVLKLKEIDSADSQAVRWGCSVKYATIPKLIDLPNQRGLVFVGLVDKVTPIIISPPNVVELRKHLRFGAKLRRAYMVGDRLYVTDPFNEDICFINVRGIFDDPTAVEWVDEDGNTQCIGDDEEYPMPEHYTSDIVSRIMQYELNMVIRTENDELNDSRETSSRGFNVQKQ